MITQDCFIELAILLYLCMSLYTAIVRRSNSFIVGFCIISLLTHATFLNSPSSRHTRHGKTHKAGMIAIGLTLLVITLRDDKKNLLLVNLAWFVLLSKILDLCSDQNTLIEEVGTLVASVCITAATSH